MREDATAVLVVGGGLGGVAAALAAADRGTDVVLAEETAWLGGQLTTSAKFINLLNEDVQQHVFGDILKRQVIGELRVLF